AGTDAAVGSADLAAHDLNPVDIDGDGQVNAPDRSLVLFSFGLSPNLAPSLAIDPLKTYTDLRIELPLQSRASDVEGDPVFVEVSGAWNGTARLSDDGISLLFTPGAGFSGAAAVTLRARDG